MLVPREAALPPVTRGTGSGNRPLRERDPLLSGRTRVLGLRANRSVFGVLLDHVTHQPAIRPTAKIDAPRSDGIPRNVYVVAAS